MDSLIDASLIEASLLDASLKDAPRDIPEELYPAGDSLLENPRDPCGLYAGVAYPETPETCRRT